MQGGTACGSNILVLLIYGLAPFRHIIILGSDPFPILDFSSGFVPEKKVNLSVRL